MKRRWWLWLILALACLIMVFGVSELTAVSIVDIFALGILGPILFIFWIFLYGLISIGIGGGVKVLLEKLISDRVALYCTLIVLGLCFMLVGLLVFKEGVWSFIFTGTGFWMGFFAGLEFQKHQSDAEQHERERMSNRKYLSESEENELLGMRNRGETDDGELDKETEEG